MSACVCGAVNGAKAAKPQSCECASERECVCMRESLRVSECGRCSVSLQVCVRESVGVRCVVVRESGSVRVWE